MFQEILNFLSNKGALPKEEWVRKIIQEQNANKDIAFNIFLNSDISETSKPYTELPNIRKPRFTLSKPIIFQVDEVTDISLNFEERKTFTANKNGTLKILLNDGQSKLIGISKEPISKLNPASTPGLKIVLNPPIEARYGVLFLSDKHITVYGGQSQKMIDQRRSILEPKPMLQRASAPRQPSQEQPKAPAPPPPAPKKQVTPPSTPKAESDSPKFISDSDIDLSTSYSSDVELIEM